MSAPTPRPWRWLMDSGDVMLWGANGDPGGEGHVLTPHVCPACRERGAPCLGPNKADEELIVQAVNDYDRLLAVEETAAGPVLDALMVLGQLREVARQTGNVDLLSALEPARFAESRLRAALDPQEAER